MYFTVHDGLLLIDYNQIYDEKQFCNNEGLPFDRDFTVFHPASHTHNFAFHFQLTCRYLFLLCAFQFQACDVNLLTSSKENFREPNKPIQNLPTLMGGSL